MSQASAWEQIQKTAHDTGKSVAEVCAAEPQLYQKYLREQGVKVVGPLVPIQKTSMASSAGDCAETRLLLAYAEPLIRQGVPKGEAIERTIRANPEWYRDHRRAMLGRGA